MTRNNGITTGLIAATLIAIAGSSLLWAQKNGRAETRKVQFWSSGDGARLGVRLTDVTSEKAKELKLPGEYGAIVSEVEKDSPAAKAGLENNDVILEFAGEKVWSTAQLRRLIQETPPGRTVSLKISRAGQIRSLNASLEARHEAFEGGTFHMPDIRIPDIKIPSGDFAFNFIKGARLGISAEELTPQLAEYFGVKQGKGVLVREVTSGSPAGKAGLKAGDCIIRVGSTEVDSIGDLHRALSKESEKTDGGKQVVTLTIVRDRHEQTVKAELESPERHFQRYSADDFDSGELERLRSEAESLRSEPPEQPMVFFGEDEDL